MCDEYIQCHCVALLALKTGWLDIAGSLPQAANDCFKTRISVGPVPGVGRLEPVAPAATANAYSRPDPACRQRPF
jgi:hypothetical protein